MSEHQEPAAELDETPSRIEQEERADRELRRMRRQKVRAEQTYRHFLKRLMAAGRMSEDFAERAAVSALCNLEHRLLDDEALDMEAQLPQKLQSLLYACSKSNVGGVEKFSRDEYVRRVAEELGMSESEAEPVIRSVLVTVIDSISEGEAEDVIHGLPAEFHDLFRRGV